MNLNLINKMIYDYIITNMNILHILNTELHNYINSFLQRTDQIAWKLTCKYCLSNLIYNIMDLNGELNLYVKTPDQMDWAWKDDPRYSNIRELFGFNQFKQYDLLKKYVEITGLWYFDFNAEFKVFEGNYVIMFLTSVPNYKINIYFTDSNDITTKSSYEPVKNKIKVSFESKGKIKVNCREINKIKNNKTVQYMMCIPEYYWNKIYSATPKLFGWNQQILCTSGIIPKNIVTKF